MCTGGDQAPASVAEALRMAESAMDYLNDPGVASLDAASMGDVLQALGGISGKFAVARAAVLARFDAGRGHDADGYGSSTSWLAAKNHTTRRAAAAEVRRMRQFREHPEIAAAVASGTVSEAWAAEMAEWTRRLPADWRHDVDKILLDASAGGAELADLAMIAQAALEKWRQQQDPGDDPDDSGFGDRYLKLGTTIDNAGRVTGDLTPECAAALQAVLEALGKKNGQEDDRTEGQRYHDALQLACQLLIRSRMLPDRAGSDTRIDAVVSLADLLKLPGASELQEAWLAALAGEHGYLAGLDAEVAACDAIVSPVVTGCPDLSVVDSMIDLVLAVLDETGPEGGPAAPDAESRTTRIRSRALSPEAWQALRYTMARLAVDLVSGPDRLAAILRQGLLDAPFNGKSIPLDIGYAASIPGHIRHAVQLRAKGHCEWPGCQARAARCDVHHLVHQSRGGVTSVNNCTLLCNYHHDVCIHRRGWRLVLHPDATTTAYGPRGQIIQANGPPRSTRLAQAAGAPAGAGPPDG
ncbi:MAG TPA: DUF222 domain-containing protein [Trebonia sp.]|nr:DUF222 domain-containing protein [Trebonia sp.]